MRSNLILFCLLVLVLVVLAVRFQAVTSRAPFAYDEADYMYAGTRGFAANYLDQPSQSLVEFVRKGLEAYFTVLLELTWPKRRILEVYLNIAEFGDGIWVAGPYAAGPI